MDYYLYLNNKNIISFYKHFKQVGCTVYSSDKDSLFEIFDGFEVRRAMIVVVVKLKRIAE